MNNNISFKSLIRPVTTADFNKTITYIGKNRAVNSPWTVKETVKDSSAYTRHIFDCSVLGLTDGINVTMLHICPTKKENKDFRKIKDYLMQKVDLYNPNLQGFLFGSQKGEFSVLSDNLYNNLLNFIKKYNIPITEIAKAKEYTDVAYQSKTDEWLISSFSINEGLSKGKSSQEVLKDVFKKIEISELDEIV